MPELLGRHAKWTLLAGIVVVFLGMFFSVRERAGVDPFIPCETWPAKHATQAPRFVSRFASHQTTAQVHAASAVALAAGKLRAFWYGGDREGGADVAIYSNAFDPATQNWTQERPIIDREITMRSVNRNIRRIGNPVAFKPTDEALWLVYVSTSLGGWSTSALNLSMSSDQGETWTPPRRLITSPFFNMSTLVKGPAVRHGNGGLSLPAYHEMAAKFSEIVHLSPVGEVTDKTRLSEGRLAIQPVVVPTSPTRAIGLMRNVELDGILQTQTEDTGARWSAPTRIRLPNPNAALSLTCAPDGALLLAFNDDARTKENLSLAYSADGGQSWRTFYVVERYEPAKTPPLPEGVPPQFSYPWLLQSSDGEFHLLYTWHRLGIKHASFNHAWLAQMLSGGQDPGMNALDAPEPPR